MEEKDLLQRLKQYERELKEQETKLWQIETEYVQRRYKVMHEQNMYHNGLPEFSSQELQKLISESKIKYTTYQDALKLLYNKFPELKEISG